jgi:predicted anti-sigma-YlaC factor YlaD
MNMKCNDVDLLLVDYLDGQLQNGEKKAVEKHLETCERCHLELMQYRELFNAIADHKLEKPGPVLKENFNTMLQSELNILATTSIIKQEEPPKRSKLVNMSDFIMKAAASILLITGGVFIGTLVKKEQVVAPTSEMAGLKNEVKEMKEALMFNLLKDQSASERIKAVAYAEDMNNPDPNVLNALLSTLNHDDNVNVRLAALNSISKFSSIQYVRDSLVNSLRMQKEPLVQIILINILTDSKEIKAIAPLKEILLNKETIQPVKDAASKGLKLL